jgi:hypothetical protein
MPIRIRVLLNRFLAVACSWLLIPFTVQSGIPELMQPRAQAAEQEGVLLSNDQLDSLVAPIALYPDPLLAQVLAASTYPLEIIQLQQWLTRNKDLKDQALADAVAKQDWDPTVQGLAGLPDVVKRLADDIAWTTDLGNAFLAQQNDVMQAVQRMRAKAKGQGNLKSNEQVKVETKTVESQQVIVIQQANPQVVYVPSYNPTVVYGPPVYPYPPIYYPPPGYYAAGMAISFGVGVAMGAMWSGGWCCNSGWGSNNNVTINNNNNFVNNSNRQNVSNRPSQQPGRGGQGGNTWQHDSQHRGGAPYADRRTADKFGGTTRGSSQAARQQSARQQQTRGQVSGRQPGGATGGRGGAGGGQGQLGGGQAGARPSQGQVGGGQAGGRGSAGGAGGADRMGNRSASPSGGGGARGGEGLGASGRGATGSGARESSARGAASMGGGGRGGGGGRRR